MVPIKKYFSLILIMSSASLTVSLLSSCAEQGNGDMPHQESTSASVSTDSKSVSSAQTLREHLTVYKSPPCGCCGEWVEHVKAAGFQSSIEHPEDLTGIKDKLGVPNDLRSCHTTISNNGFVFEGHIPARYIQAFLANPPKDSLGLTVPGMPVGSPGMEVDDKFMPYKVFSLEADGSVHVYANIDSPEKQF